MKLIKLIDKMNLAEKWTILAEYLYKILLSTNVSTDLSIKGCETRKKGQK